MMAVIETLLPGIQSFLSVDLSTIQLPPHVEQKRQRFLELIEVLSLGPIPPLPKNSHITTNPVAINTVIAGCHGGGDINTTNTVTTTTNICNVSVLQRRPLSSSIARFFSNKRHSLPPTISCPSPPSVPIDSFKIPVTTTSGTSVDKRNSQVSDVFQSSLSSSGHSIHGISYESPSDNKSVYSFDRTRNSLISSSVSSTLPPPLPPKKSQLHKLFCKLDDPYEVPKHATTVLVTNTNTTTAAESVTCLTSSLSASSTITPIRSKSSITSTNEMLYRKKQFNRLSLSPQLEIIQDKKSDSTVPHDWLDNNTAVSKATTTLVDSMGLSDTIDAIKQDRTLILPKKNVNGCQTRRPSSSLTDPIWTLAGILSHRYKSNKWIQLNLCLLTNDSRLVAYKTGHSMTPSLALFLYGSTGIYSGRDSGMEHVIKIVHSSREIIVLAAPTEEQALIWVQQINQYSQGSIPMEVCSFLPHLNVPNSANTQTSTTFTINANKNISYTTDRNFTSPQLTSCNNRSSSTDVTDLQVDSEFLTLNKTTCTESVRSVNPTKSLSFDNRNAGVLLSSCETNSQLNRKGEKSVTSHRMTTSPIDDVINTNDSSLNGSIMTDSIHRCLSSSVVIPSRPLSSMTLSSVFDTSTINLKQNSRRSSLISSMRRKVESFSSKRRIRKSLPQSLEPLTNSYSNVSEDETALKGHRRMLSDGQWKNNLSSSKFSSVQCLQQQSQHMISSLSLPPPPAACVWNSFGNSGKGFGWSHLVSAGVRFLNQNTTPTVIPSSSTNNNRPLSVRYDSSAATSDPFSSQIYLTSNYGPLLDLSAIRSHSTASYTNDASNDNHIVIAGDAFISIPDQVPWTIKWCCLRLNCLEIYQNSRKDYSKVSQNSNQYIDENYNWPIFSLPLNSDKVELGLAGSSDKRHSSAIRLSVPTECTTPLLFDAIDKTQMGSWIRGFIQALGLVGPTDVAHQKNYSLHSTSSIEPKNTVLLRPSYVSVQENHIHSVPLIKNHTVLPSTTTMNPLTSTSLIHRIPNSIMETSQTSMYYSDIHDNDVDDDVDNSNNNNSFFVNVKKQETSLSSSNIVIYDEVCPPQPSFTTVTNNITITTTTTTTANTPATSLISSTETTRNPPSLSFSKRRWSSPLLIVDSCTKFPGSVYLSNIESNSALLTNNNSNNNNKSSHWHIPPPSRRLLAQPLPPLPSVGPSTCESMAGTITSDGSCTSSNVTPDDFVGCVDDVNDDNNGYQNEDEHVKLIRSTNINLETDNYSLYWSRKDKMLDGCNLPSSLLNRRYASMSSLEYSLPFNKSSTSIYDNNSNDNGSTNEQKKPKRKNRNTNILKQFYLHKQCHSWIHNNDNKAENNTNCTLDIMNNSGSNSVCTTFMTDGIYSSPSCTAFTFISESDNTTLHKTDPDLVTKDTTNSTCTTTTTSTCTNVISNDGDNDNNSRRNSGDEVSLWNVKAENFLCSRDPALVEYMKSSKLISARRCVSCLTGNKPTILQKNSNLDGIPISSSTLPVRCGSDDTATTIMNTEAITSDPILCQKFNIHYWNRNSYSSNSSRTATSSGVALTAEFSSPGSGGTTRPSSVAMPNNHPSVTLVEEEQTNVENSAIHIHSDWYDLPLNLGQSKDTRKYQSSSEYGCQVEIPTSNLSMPNCHQYPHNIVNSMNENNISDSITVKDSIQRPTSLVLITSQLEEIKQETNSLRSRIRNLSFQLSNLHGRDDCNQYVRNVESLPKSDIVSISTPNNEIHLDKVNTSIDKNLCNNNGNNNNMLNDCNRKVIRLEDEETTANLYARLTTIEILLRNAESTEARLEKEFSHLIINNEKPSLPPPPSSSLSTVNVIKDLKQKQIFDEKSLINVSYSSFDY
ncbi:unnamed protein product [Schistosoma rodhaini]|uniref:PH domain-containing protein n=1 Tax=Schistosoma rodhaini TaxID=6188 RepID=A0AA85GB85_9TREM|nr:unnamed protein product [Schistosoma rodhaini]